MSMRGLPSENCHGSPLPIGMVFAEFFVLTQSRLIMSAIITQDLKYGIIYVCGNPKQTGNLRWFASMIEPMIRPLSLQWVSTWEIDHTLIVARRFNVGNIGKYATVQLHLNRYGYSNSYSLLAAVHAFSDCLQDVMDDSEGDVIIKEEDYSDRNEPPHGKWGASTSSAPIGNVLRDFELDYGDMPQDHTRVELPVQRSIKKLETPLPQLGAREASEEKPSLGKRLKKLSRKLRKQYHDEEIISREEHRDEKRIICDAEESIILSDKDLNESFDDAAPCVQSLNEDVYSSSEPETIDIEAEEVQEFRRIESEYERDVRDLRARIVAFIAKYQEDPQQLMATVLQGKVLLSANPGHVLVNGDMKIVLPEYDEMEIRMPAMSRTIYILFMKHRIQSGNGIVLKNIGDYRNEIIDIYSMVKPGANEARVEESVNNLCNPLSEALNQVISRANHCIRNVITDKELAKQYIISGSRGEEYSISLAPEFMMLPRAVTGN